MWLRLAFCCLLVALVTGCGSVNTFLADSLADKIPAWAGGLPADAPPRVGDPRYDKWIEEQNAKAAMPKQSGPDPKMLQAIH